jgi:exodeoxyribonuclease V beta subunit
MARKVVNTPLDAQTGLRLAEVKCEHRLNELEFHYPLARLQIEGFREVLLKHGCSAQAALRQRIEALSFRPTLGYMTGFIDLVFEAGGRFYLVDYKSNWLGSMIEDYVAPRLLEVMGRDNYYLQYLVYTVALHRYLKQRLPAYDYDTHFGGVMYLFLRGMEPRLGPLHGVYRDRPARDLLEALDRYFQLGRIGD